jgi:hypothetical protein
MRSLAGIGVDGVVTGDPRLVRHAARAS